MVDEPVEILAHKSHVNDVAFSPDGKFLVSAGMDNLVKLWSPGDWELFSTFFGHEKSANSLSFTPDGEHLATASTDGTVRVWTFPFGQPEEIREGYTSARISPRGDVVASRDRKDRIRLWSLESGEVRATLDHEARVTATAFSPDGERLLASPAGREVVCWRVDSGEEEVRFPADETAVAALGFFDEGRRLVATGHEGTARVFSTDGWAEELRFDVGPEGAYPLAMAPDESEVAVACAHRIRLFDTGEGSLREEREVEPKGVYALAYSPDGRWLAMGAADKKIRVWKRSAA